MNSALSIDRVEYVLSKKKQTIETVSANSGISIKELSLQLGFIEKYVATDDETSLGLAKEAVCKLMSNCTVLPDEIDYIIFAHSGICEDGQLRSPSAKIQALIKANRAFCFEVTNGCNSLNAALHISNGLLANRHTKTNILIVVSDTLSKFVDFSKKNVMHFYMYSDGAAAMMVNNYGESNKIVSSALYTDGSYADISKIRYKTKPVGNVIPVMEAQVSGKSKLQLYDALVSNYIKVIKECISKHELQSTDIKFLFLSQNSKKILSDVLNYFNFNADKTLFTGKHLGHVGPIDSIIAFYNSLASGNLDSGDYVILAGTGVGFHWGAHLIKV
jgi:3-oxoacyl-[acyl-carrier-protein] synthase-3